MRRMPMPPRIPPLGSARSVSDAHVTTSRAADGRRRTVVEHAPLQGITPAMLLWWFRNVEGDMGYRDQEVTRDREWHPDHLLWELRRPSPAGGYGAGARVRRVERFAGDSGYYFDLTWLITRYDKAATTRVVRLFGATVVEREDRWIQVGRELRYTSVLTLGMRGRLGRLLNRTIFHVLVPRGVVAAWVTHNVEEVGFLEWILVGLYVGEGPDSLASGA